MHYENDFDGARINKRYANSKINRKNRNTKQQLNAIRNVNIAGSFVEELHNSDNSIAYAIA